MVKHIFLWTILLVACGCSTRIQKIEELFAEKEAVGLILQPTSFESNDIIGLLSRYCMVDDYILMLNNSSGELISIYDTRSERYIKSAGKRGRAGNEMLNIIVIAGVPESGSVFVFGSPQRATFVTIRELLEPIPSLKMFDFPVNCLNTMPISGNKYFASCLAFESGGKQFAILDSTFNIITFFDDYPKCDNDSDLIDYDKAFGHQYQIMCNGEGNKVVCASNIGCVIKFFDVIDSVNPLKTKEYIFELPAFESELDSQGRSVTFYRDNIKGFLSVAASTDKCYCLYSGRSIIDENNGESDIIYVFDFNGDPLNYDRQTCRGNLRH